MVTATWNAATFKLDLSWPESTNPHLDHYSLRTSPEPKYDQSKESVVATIAKGTTHVSTNTGLAAQESTVLLKLYTVLDTGNEKGSATIKFTRPEIILPPPRPGPPPPPLGPP